MELRYVILARYAEFNPDSVLTLVGGDHDKFVADKFAFKLPVLTAAIRLTMGLEEADISHTIRCAISEEATGDPVHDGVELVVQPLTIPESSEDEKIGIGFVIQLWQVDIPRAGKYKLDVLVDGVQLGSATFRVATRDYYEKRGAVTPVRSEAADDSHDN